MSRKRKPHVKNGHNYLFYMRPVDRRMIEFLQQKNTLPVSATIRLALAFHCEALGMNIAELIEESAAWENVTTEASEDASTPA